MKTQHSPLSYVTVLKLGGALLEDTERMNELLQQLALRSQPVVLVHGGGRRASTLAMELGLHVTMHNGRRITTPEMLEVVVMTYGGTLNRWLTAQLTAAGKPALGICAYEAGLLLARRRPPTPVDYGEVGDVVGRNGRGLRQLVEAGFWPVIAPLTASPEGHLLNTNADTIACEVACALQETGLQVELVLAFELPGVLEEVNRPESLIRHLDYDTYTRMQAAGQVHAGMLPKLDNAFRAAQAGVQVRLGTPWDWLQGTPRATFLESSSPNPQC